MNADDRPEAAAKQLGVQFSADRELAAARQLIALADGFEAGLRASESASDDAVMFPRLARVVARDAVRLARDLEFARSAHIAMQAQRDRLDEQLQTYRTRLAALTAGDA
jgi:hypothetical protein